MQPKFRYLRPQFAGRATIAYTTVLNADGTSTFYAGISYCGPNDTYTKTYGRDKAGGRLAQAIKYGPVMAAGDPDKFIVITGNKTVGEFLQEAEQIASEFLPAAVFVEQYYEALAEAA